MSPENESSIIWGHIFQFFKWISFRISWTSCEIDIRIYDFKIQNSPHIVVYISFFCLSYPVTPSLHNAGARVKMWVVKSGWGWRRHILILYLKSYWHYQNQKVAWKTSQTMKDLFWWLSDCVTRQSLDIYALALLRLRKVQIILVFAFEEYFEQFLHFHLWELYSWLCQLKWRSLTVMCSTFSILELAEGRTNNVI